MTSLTTWRYHLLTNSEVTEDALNVLGDDGWELVATIGTSVLVFKRPGPDFRERVTLDQRAAATAADTPGEDS